MLSENAKKIVSKISQFLEENKLSKEEDFYLKNELSIIFEDIERIKKEYESQIFFLVTTGAIKTGKSTLINLLANNKKVSTTQQGKETTLRPVIICKGKEDCILLFNTTKSSQLKEYYDETIKQLNKHSIDFIKGFYSEEELKEKFLINVIRKEFNDENLKKYLTEKNIEGESEPKLVNIQIKIDSNLKNSLLNQHIAIIDTPGIDGILATAEGEKDGSSSNNLDLMSRVDLMLFLQSSVSPINFESKTYLEKLASNHKITNVRLVHNKFTIKPWRKEYGLIEDPSEKEIDKNSKENAQKLFKNTFADLKANIVDFAQAEDGYKYNYPTLIEESGFEKFQEELYNDIIINRRSLQEDRVNNQIKTLIEANKSGTSKATIKNVLEEIKQREKELKNEETEIINKIELIQSFFINNQKILRLIDIAQENNQEIDDGYQFEEILNKYTEEYPVNILINDKDKKTKIKEAIEKSVEKENNTLKTKLNSVSQFNTYIAKYQFPENNKKMEDFVLEFNTITKDIQINLFKFNINMEESLNKVIINSESIITNAENLADSLSTRFIELPFNDKQIKNISSEVKEQIKTESKKVVEDFRLKIKNEIELQFKNYALYLDSKKREVSNFLENKNKNKKAQLDKTKGKLKKLEDFFEDLSLKI